MFKGLKETMIKEIKKGMTSMSYQIGTISKEQLLRTKWKFWS